VRRPQRVLIIVQNLPVPLDRRVWLECQALVRAGYAVSVICPRGPGDARRQHLDGVDLYKYSPPPEARGFLSYAWEFAYCCVRTAVLSLVAYRAAPFRVIQACNPPDTYWLLALLWGRLGVRFVFDQHDLNPELFASRFGAPTSRAQRVQYAGLRWLERMTYRVADRVISTNESYRAIAMGRGGREGADVTVVRSGPDTHRMRPVVPGATLPPDTEHLLVYLGVMGPQDDADVVLAVMDELVHRRGRNRVRAALLGFGDCLEELKRTATRLGLDDHVEFTGRVGPDGVAAWLSAADVGVCPDLKTPLNDVSTMNKTMEYMAYCLPSVTFDLVETRVSAADTAFYVPSRDVAAFASAVERLLDDPDLRARMGAAARERVVAELDWRPQAQRYLEVFDDLLRDGVALESSPLPDSPPPPEGREYVPLDDPESLATYIRTRGRVRM